MSQRLFAILCAVLFACAAPARAELENHYSFDTEATMLVDASGNSRDALIDDLEVGWVEDPVRGGVMEFGGNTNGFLVAESDELPAEGFTIMLWAYRDPDFAGGAGGANDGLFQLTNATDDLEFLPVPPTGDKVVGGWVQKSDNAVWGRIIDDFANVNLDKLFVMEDEEWTHFAYRGNGEEFELVVNGESDDIIVDYEGLAPHDTIYIGRQGTETWGGRLDDFRIYSDYLTDDQIKAIMEDEPVIGGVLGDFNDNMELDAADIDLLTTEVQAGTNNASFDLDNSTTVDAEDRRVWVEDLKNTFFGDANLDGEFNSSDFVTVFGAAKYETGSPATWSEGDWNGDGVDEFGSYFAAFGGGGYEKGPRPVAAVPEPSAMGLAFLGLLGLLAVRRR